MKIKPLVKLPINPKRIQLVRDFRMLEEKDWPDDMSLEKLYEFCLVTGFLVDFFRQDDPPELGEILWCCPQENLDISLL